MKKANKILILMMTIFVIFFIVIDINSYASMITFPNPTTESAGQQQGAQPWS